MKKKFNNNLNLFQEKILNILSKIFLSSFLIISFFYVTPMIINFSDKNFNNKEYTNNSKKILAYTLNSNEKKIDQNSVNDEEDLLIDIFSLNDLESDTVRLSAATIKQLFEDTGYSLKDVREKKLLKGYFKRFLTKYLKIFLGINLNYYQFFFSFLYFI